MLSGLPGFSSGRITLDEVTLSVHQAGSGPALILLHGYPQNHMCWHRVAPAFADRFRVIVPDLRGYGDSDAPPDDATHAVYSKRRMARDIVALMDRLDLPRAHVLGHDRGGRVAYRMALDHPDRVTRLGIIEIVPTGDFWDAWGADLAMAAYHWTFLAQPAPLPERLIGADPVGYVDHTLASWTRSGSLGAFSPEALAAYRRQAADPARIHAMCADYRAGATTDRALDLADRAAGRRIAAPLRFLWAEGGFPARTGDPAGLWRRWADQVSDASCLSGHFAMEEAPEAVLRTFLPFFDPDGDGAN
jgi:haloacetate dehalogenase